MTPLPGRATSGKVLTTAPPELLPREIQEKIYNQIYPIVLDLAGDVTNTLMENENYNKEALHQLLHNAMEEAMEEADDCPPPLLDTAMIQQDQPLQQLDGHIDAPHPVNEAHKIPTEPPSVSKKEN